MGLRLAPGLGWLADQAAEGAGEMGLVAKAAFQAHMGNRCFGGEQALGLFHACQQAPGLG